MKNEAYPQAVKQVTSLSQSNVTVTSPDQRVVYVADYYNDAQKRLTAVTVVVRDAGMNLLEPRRCPVGGVAGRAVDPP